jgi:hypothetical protein
MHFFELHPKNIEQAGWFFGAVVWQNYWWVRVLCLERTEMVEEGEEGEQKKEIGKREGKWKAKYPNSLTPPTPLTPTPTQLCDIPPKRRNEGKKEKEEGRERRGERVEDVERNAYKT